METKRRSERPLFLLGIFPYIFFGLALGFFGSLSVGEDRLIPPSIFTEDGRAKRAEIKEMLGTVNNLAEARELAMRAPYKSTLDAMAERHYKELSREAVASAKTAAELRQACEDSHVSIKYGSACKSVRDAEERDLIAGRLS